MKHYVLPEPRLYADVALWGGRLGPGVDGDGELGGVEDVLRAASKLHRVVGDPALEVDGVGHVQVAVDGQRRIGVNMIAYARESSARGDDRVLRNGL